MNTRTRTITHLAGCAAVASLWIAIPSANAQFTIDPSTNYLVGTRPSGVAAGDFDNDGDMDLATVVDNPDRIAILLNDGTGQYSLGPSTFLPSSSSPQDVVAGDLDGDGDIDLAVAVRDPLGSVLIMLNVGDATFTMSGIVPVGARPRGLTIADMDNDGDLDLAVANRDSNTASVLTNNGGGGFTAQTFAAGNEPRATALVDFNSDGDLDLAVTIHDDRTVATFTNNGGVFSPSTVLFVGGQVRPDGMTAADLDGDGDDDLAVATSSTSPTINQVTLFLNTGAGFIGPFNYATAGQNTSKVAAGDLDCDGAIDLAVSNSDSTTLSLLQNLGGGAFGPAMNVGAGVHPGAVIAVDLDGDGDADLAAANRDSNDLSVLINQTCKPAPPAEVLPTGFTVVEGLVLSGGLEDLFFSDDSRMVVIPSTLAPPSGPEAPVQIEIVATSTIQTPSELVFRYEGHVFMPDRSISTRQRTSLFNYVTQSYDELDNRLAASTDEVFEIVITANPGDYIEPGTGNMMAFITYKAEGLSGFLFAVSNLDQTVWMIAQ